MRALCQQLPDYPHMAPRSKRARARDVFDICGAIDSGLVDRVNLAAIVPEVFRAKRVDPGLLVRLREDFARSFHAPDFRSVELTVRDPATLRSFDEYYDRVLDLVSRLEIPGNP
ncbi:MAG: hypothetical protein IT350_20640 [Deltaproteobacteria bacterium]|nr:hypothetical protein [Deltaproteobacteria bacterium]